MSTLLPTIESLGTIWHIEIFEDISSQEKKDLHLKISAELQRFNDTYSRFLPTSLVSRLNNERMIIDPPQEFKELLQIAVEWYIRTEGAFNILVEDELVRRGYDAAYSFREAHQTPKPPSSLNTSLTISDNCVQLSEGRIDFGGFGKGYAIDTIATLLKNNNIQYFLINGGGDMYVTSNNEEAVDIFLEHPTIKQAYLAKVALKNQGFASSSTHTRRWGDHEKHHIVNTTSNDTSYDASYVVAKNTVTADIVATTSLFALKHIQTQDTKTAYAVYNIKEEKLLTSSNFTNLTIL